MERLFDDELIELKRKLLTMSDTAQQMMRLALFALSRRDADAVHQVTQLEVEVNALEMEIERESLRLFALRQPAAVDLRFLIAALKICSNLERVADESVNIAEASLRIKDGSRRILPSEFPIMAGIAEKMLRNSVHAFVHHDAEEAELVCKEDSAADQIYKGYLDELVGQVQPADAGCMVYPLLALRSLERIADHASNIAEEVIFIEEGKSVRHQLN